MKNITILSFLLIMYIGCTPVPEANTNLNSCRDIQKEINRLEKEKRINITTKVLSVLSDGLYPKTNIKDIDQKIKILKLKHSSCTKSKKNNL